MFLFRLLQLALFLVLMRVVLRFLGAFMAGLRGEPRQARPAPPVLATDLVRDRVCNTFVPRANALHEKIRGDEQHFCSIACRDKALALSRAS